MIPNSKHFQNHENSKTFQNHDNSKHFQNHDDSKPFFPGDVVLVEPAGDPVTLERWEEAANVHQSLASSW